MHNRMGHGHTTLPRISDSDREAVRKANRIANAEMYQRGRSYAQLVLATQPHTSAEVQALWTGIRFDNDHYGLGVVEELREQNVIRLSECKDSFVTRFWKGVAAYATYKMEKSRG